MKNKKILNELKSPLRYPGGKTKAQKYILPRVPYFEDFREPFVGGGSTFIALKQRTSESTSFTINDLYYDLYCFWNQLKINGFQMIESIQDYRDKWRDGRELFTYLTDENRKWSDFEKAVRFFILNRITFSGTIESGGYSNQAFKIRFTQSSIDRLKPFPDFLENVEVEYGDYEKIVKKPGKDVFIFLDPPYLSATESRLYGKNGELHLAFDHERFADNMKKCEHKWLITYDDSPRIRELFDFAFIEEWIMQYGMNNYMQSGAKAGRELFISNYETSQLKRKRVVQRTLF